MERSNYLNWDESIQILSRAVLERAPHDKIVAELLRLINGFNQRPFQEQATWHPTGFLVLPLNERNDDLLVRIHIWPVIPRKPPIPNWPIHKHAWRIDSHILIGMLIDEVFQVQLADDSDTALYAPACTAEGNVLMRTHERVHCDSVQRIAYRGGEQYSIMQNVFHVSHAVNGFMATVVVMTLPNFGSTRVVGDICGTDYYRSERIVASPDEVHELLQTLYTFLNTE
jgi:hypothetical protein